MLRILLKYTARVTCEAGIQHQVCLRSKSMLIHYVCVSFLDLCGIFWLIGKPQVQEKIETFPSFCLDATASPG